MSRRTVLFSCREQINPSPEAHPAASRRKGPAHRKGVRWAVGAYALHSPELLPCDGSTIAVCAISYGKCSTPWARANEVKIPTYGCDLSADPAAGMRLPEYPPATVKTPSSDPENHHQPPRYPEVQPAIALKSRYSSPRGKLVPCS